ncbi:uncharacterized protein [Epargyreus clarus]|uniref:uncharacterized protein n=1 Tax=Epargyreus clarus TaxID=520877 RepID=UPI003C2C5DFB
MVDAETLLSPVLEKIAKEQDYDDYKTDISLFVSGGANYTSQLYNITISAPKKDDLKLFAKVAVLGEKLRSLTTMQVFETEIMFYTKIMEKYREYEERYNFPKEERLVLPKYYGGSTEYMKETIVLEELSAQGYQAFDRFKCYDWEYASKCVSILARIHALSVRFERENTEEFEDLIEKLAFKFPMNDMKDMMEKAVAGAIGATAEEYRGRLAMFIQQNMTEENILKFYNPTRKVVLNHGDFRPSNVLHKTNENGELEVVLIDYQVLQKGNPVSDLLYFFILGSDEHFREKHKDQYFNHYYEEFSKTLKRLEIDPDDVYTKEDFDGDVKEMLPIGIVIGMISLPFVTVDVQNAPSLEDGIDLQSFDMELSDIFRKRFNALVKDYVNMGIL